MSFASHKLFIKMFHFLSSTGGNGSSQSIFASQSSLNKIFNGIVMGVKIPR